MPSRPIRAARLFHSERTQPTRPAPLLSFIARPTANTSVFHRTKGLRQGHRHSKQGAKPHLAGLRHASRLPRTGPLGCGVHFCEYSARQAVCIRVGSVNQHLQWPLYCVLEQEPWSQGRKHELRERIGRHKKLRGPYVAILRRCRQYHDAENSAFCTAQTGVGTGKTELRRYFMHNGVCSMQIKKCSYRTRAFRTIAVAYGRPQLRCTGGPTPRFRQSAPPLAHGRAQYEKRYFCQSPYTAQSDAP